MRNITNSTVSEKPLQSSGTKTVMQTLTVRPARVEAADISTWSNAINAYKNGNRTAWYNLCDNLMSDGVLADSIDKLVEDVTGAEIAFQIDGKVVDIIDDLMDTPEFEELLKEIALAKVYGRSVIECGFAPAFSVYSYPRKNCIIKNMDKSLSERIKFIAAKEGDTGGYDYSKDEFIFECGKDDDLGLIFRAAQYVIYKRGNFGDWAQFAEIFGMPFLLGKYNSTDTNARDQLFEALSQIGGKPVAAIPKESEVEVVQNSSTGSSALYKDLKDACNEEILIAIQGETMTTLSGSSLSQSKVHQDTNTKKGKALKRYVQRMLNKHLVPLLIKRGYPVVGGKFVFPKSAEELTVDEIISLSEIIDIPASHLHEKFGLPMAKDGEQLAKKTRPTAGLTPPLEGGREGSVPPEPPSPAKAVETGHAPSKKDVKLSDDDIETFEKMYNFFVNARTTRSRAELNLADSSTNFTAGINIDKLFEKALKDIYKQYGIASPIPLSRGAQQAGWSVSKPLFDISNKAYQKAIDDNLQVEFGKKNEAFINEFKQNAAVFAAFKTHAQGKDIAAQLLDADGNLKSYDKFRKSVLGTSIKSDYNENWLKTEYNMAVRSARMATKLKQYETTKRLYPNLEFMPSTAAEQREEHKEFYGTILPIGHKWWDTHTPPLDWGCECSIRNTDKPVTGTPDGEPVEPAPVFAFNPAKEANFIKMEEHPYVKGVCKNFNGCKTRMNLSDKPLKPECGICAFANMQVKKSLSTLEREKYLSEMQALITKVIEKTVMVENQTKTIQVKFTKEGNKHLYSDTFSRAKGILKKEELKTLDKVLGKATFMKTAGLSKKRNDKIVGFYYYEAKINGKTCYLNVAEKEVISKGRTRKIRFLYSVTKWLK